MIKLGNIELNSYDSDDDVFYNLGHIKSNSDKIWIVSGGFKDIIDPIVKEYEIPSNRVLANKFEYDVDKVIGCDEDNDLFKDKGKILAIEKFNDWSINHLIKLYKQIDDWANATEYLKILFEMNNNMNYAKLALYKVQEGRVLLKNNDFNLSREAFEEALNLNSDLNICYYFMGNAFADESNSIYDSAIELENEVEGSLEKNEQSQKLKVDAENILAKAITMWGHFIENMPEYSWLILSTLKDALQALNKYNDIDL